jgi:hypothetical protein
MSISDEIKARVLRLNKEADECSKKIRHAEELLKVVPGSVDSKWCWLEWNSKTQRICYEGKPLIEAKLKDRFSHVSELSGLIDAVITNTEGLVLGNGPHLINEC